ncbi:MAG TPA: UvrD-helicase domain-containing protein, partial [Hyphomicrobiales bacterium]|nr:UvrD-helicase domain-containing protein [Hyphomicrobiales bacterium]
MTASGARRSGPTPDQAAAADPAASAWVNASAGSGKTFVLARRVLRLLRQGVAPGRILCLTFTRAAAAEMAKRVFLELGRWATLPDGELTRLLEDLEGETPDAASLARARRLFAEALETPGGLKIQTIHAFAERVLHRFPFEANVPAHFDVLDDATATELRAKAQGEILVLADSSPDSPLARALDIVAARTGDGGFFALLATVIAQRGQLERWTGERGGLEPALAHLAYLLGADEAGDAAAMRAGLLDATLFPAAEWPPAIEILNSGSAQDQNLGAALAGALAAAAEARRAAFLSVFFTQKEKPRARLMTKTLTAANPALADILAAEQNRLAAAISAIQAQESFEASAALFRLAHGIVARYGELKRAAGMLDYEDLIGAMLALVTRREDAQWVLYKLDGGIDHILVDEAQDTSPAQWAIIAALAEEALSGSGAREVARTIFAVGDGKQSIYSFQGADPEKFDDMRKFFARRSEAAALAWRQVPLTVSFRSGPAVLEAVDRVFAPPQARAGLAAGETPISHTPHRADAPGLVEIWPPEEVVERSKPDHWAAPLDRIDMESPRARLAQRIAATINCWLAKGKMLQARGRVIRPGDILILVRRRNEFVDVLISCLRGLDIPVAGADRLVVQDHIAVMDLMTAGDVALLPEDDLSLATLLKSPLVGLGEEDLLELAAGRKGSLWAELRTRRGEARFAR